MPALGRVMFDDRPHGLRRRIVVVFAALALVNLAAWVWAAAAFADHPLLLGTAFLAYSFGLRHALDADHIASIDNVTRKLMQQGSRPVGVGLFFALGHSTVVGLATAAIAMTSSALNGRFAEFREIGSMVGTGVSAFFLLAIALVNLLILAGIWRSFAAVRRGERLVAVDFDLLLAKRAGLARLFRPLFRLVGRSWHMYLLGLLFGLGFDTATEIGLIGIAAAETTRGLSPWSIMVFPALFTAGMSLVDTADGVLMLGAYGWAFVKPIRKLYYNLTITLASVLVAAVIGGVEALGLIADRLGLEGRFWSVVGALNDNLGSLGYVIVALFAASWLISALIYRVRGYDEIEVAVD